MDDNKKFSIREYREALYSDIVKRKKEQRRKWQAKYLQKLGVTDITEIEASPEKIVKEEE
jgi:mitogen-activated protein kinase 15